MTSESSDGQREPEELVATVDSQQAQKRAKLGLRKVIQRETTLNHSFNNYFVAK